MFHVGCFIQDWSVYENQQMPLRPVGVVAWRLCSDDGKHTLPPEHRHPLLARQPSITTLEEHEKSDRDSRGEEIEWAEQKTAISA